ncbi:MAG: molybdopterin-binding protein, partial [Pseudomonadota bacterium]
MSTQREFLSLNIAVLTVSDSRTLAEDTSGQLLVDRLEDAGHRCFDRQLVADDKYAIRAVTSGWIHDPQCDAVLTTGG